MNEPMDSVYASELTSKAREMEPVLPVQSVVGEPETASAAMPRWRMALLVVSSACMSGIAVVVWNRRTLRRLRQATPAAPENENSGDSKTWSEFI